MVLLPATLGSAFLARSQDVTVTARVKVVQQESQTEAAHAENVVVWLSPMGPASEVHADPKQPLRLTQHNKSFDPHVLVVPVGSVVQFPNRDPFFHNVFSLFEGKRFDLGLYEAGTTRNVSFDRPGVSYIFCNIHAEMSAVIIALDTPYYGISNRKGEIVMPNVPAGRYIMKTWYETAPPDVLEAMSREVNVTDNSSSLGILRISASAAATAAHKNKYGMDYEPATPDSPGYEQHP